MARRGADQFIAESQAGSRHFLEIICLVVRGRIRLACGDRDGALQDAAAALEFAKQASEPQMLQPALAFHARVLLAAGRTNEAGAEASELLVMLAKERAVVAENDWSNDLAIVLQALGRGAELAQFPTRTTPTPWLQAATAFATGEFDRAAELYAQIGSLPDEAFARLCSAKQLVAAGHQAEAKAQVDRVLAFYRAAGASAYLRDGEVLLGVSA